MSASPFAQRTAHVAGEGWRAAPGVQTHAQMPAGAGAAATSSSASTAAASPAPPTAAGSSSASYTIANGAVAGPSTQRAASSHAASSSSHSSHAYFGEAGPSTAASEMNAAVYGEANGASRASGIELSPSDAERHAAKARRMSAGGSRVPSEEPGSSMMQDTEGRYREHHQRSSSSRGTAATANSSSSISNGTNGTAGPGSSRSGNGSTRREASGTGTPPARRSEERPHLDLATFPPHDLLRVLATLLHQIATANDKLRPTSSVGAKSHASDGTSGSAAGSSASSERKRRHREHHGPPEMAIAPGAEGMTGVAGGSGTASGSSTSSVMSPSVEAAMGGFDADGNPRRRVRPTTAAMAALQAPTSTLCFHARNVPSISIEAYLMRILKYCPTTNEVFLSLLVYFDRMSRMGHRTTAAAAASSSAGHGGSLEAGSGHDGADVKDGSAARSESATSRASTPSTAREDASSTASSSAVTVLADGMPPDGEPHVGIRGFAIDSYNVHRLVIAGVTVASKFFSDVFYTNSRYAKVGGLPVHELNQLELQFLLLNDFSLMIPLEEMQHYADQLLFYASAPSTASSSATAAAAPPAASATSSAQSGTAPQSRDHHGDTAMHVT